jgi:hypothetical protein
MSVMFMRPPKREMVVSDLAMTMHERSLSVETFVVDVDENVFHAAYRGQASLWRENLRPERFLLGSISYLSLYAAATSVERGFTRRMYPVKWDGSGKDTRLFDLPVSLDPSKPDNWVQCLPEASIRSATFSKMPANIGVGRGLAADRADTIRKVVESVEMPEQRRIILPDDAYAELAKTVVVTSYWDDKYPRKPEQEWTGNERAVMVKGRKG